MISCLSRAFVLKQLRSVLARWAGWLTWRKRNIVLPTSNVSTALTDSTAATSSKATTAFVKRSSHPESADAREVESVSPIKCAVISSASTSVVSSLSTSAHVDTDSTFCAELGGRFDACAGGHAHNIQFHSHFIELKDCLSESNNYNQMKIHMKTLTKVAE